jgi:hypothetical protein
MEQDEMQPARKQNSAPNRQTLQKLRDSLKALDKGAYWGTPDHDVAGIPSGAAKNTPRKQARFQLEPGVLHEIFADHLLPTVRTTSLGSITCATT